MQNKTDIPIKEDENADKRRERYSRLMQLPKNELISLFPSKLDKSHLTSEPKSNIAHYIAAYEFPPKRRKAMQQNKVEAKKLAIIKSNAAPEVKLKAL